MKYLIFDACPSCSYEDICPGAWSDDRPCDIEPGGLIFAPVSEDSVYFDWVDDKPYPDDFLAD